MRDWIATGRLPLPTAKIVQALLDAATELQQDGWASVEAAKNWATSRYPNERPEAYGCRTWRQVIHEARLFELQARKVDGRRHEWYRTRARKDERTSSTTMVTRSLTAPKGGER